MRPLASLLSKKSIRQTPGNDCQACKRKICCLVFHICDNKERIVKPSWAFCDHLEGNGRCSIYDNRHKYPGFSFSCAQYTCHGIGPLLDEWLQENSIPIQIHSSQISHIMRSMEHFVLQNKKQLYQARRDFIQQELLTKQHTIPGLIQWLSRDQDSIDAEFLLWRHQYKK